MEKNNGLKGFERLVGRVGDWPLGRRLIDKETRDQMLPDAAGHDLEYLRRLECLDGRADETEALDEAVGLRLLDAEQAGFYTGFAIGLQVAGVSSGEIVRALMMFGGWEEGGEA